MRGNFLGSLKDLQVLENFLVSLEEDNLSNHGDDDNNVNRAESEVVSLMFSWLFFHLSLISVSHAISNFVVLNVWIQLGSPGLDELISFVHFLFRSVLGFLGGLLLSLDGLFSDVHVVEHLIEIFGLGDVGGLEGSTTEVNGDIFLCGNSFPSSHKGLALTRYSVPSNEEESDTVESSSEGDSGVLVVLAPSGNGGSHNEVKHDEREEEHGGGHHIELVVESEFVC